ncbi:tetratricopeptide repeat protein [Algimonas porphyrae]|uniref:Beta-lactamase n=1 Tax=Algimonas porphyrae TaxID=1128113 RepID=A0ABQ5UZY7_9PROT|nr:tetratricopeptide repeat protein [Algimonas porphyrae]GLQ20816.1 hypothetical protein GCM10007854_17710 [Algimonas porphyrae]
MRFSFTLWLSVTVSVLSATQGAAQHHLSIPASSLPAMEARCGNGSVASCEQLAHYYDSVAKHGGDRGLSADQAFTLKLDWAEKSCNAGGAYGCDASGWAYEHGQETRSMNHDKAFDYYAKGCALRSRLSCNNLALAQRHGRGVKASEAAALVSFKKACDLGYDAACSEIPTGSRTLPASDRQMELSDFPGRSDRMSDQDCAALYDDILAALRSPQRTNGQTLSDNVFAWAQTYETTKTCPPVPAKPRTYQRPELAPEYAAPLPGLFLPPAQVPQSEYETFMQCAGQFDGGMALLYRITDYLTPEGKQYAENQKTKGRRIGEMLARVRVNFPIMAPHIDEASGERAYRSGRSGFDNLANATIDEQADYYVKSAALSPDCIGLASKYAGLRAAYSQSRRSLEN